MKVRRAARPLQATGGRQSSLRFVKDQRPRLGTLGYNVTIEWLQCNHSYNHVCYNVTIRWLLCNHLVVFI